MTHVTDQNFQAAARALCNVKMGTEAVAPLLYDLVLLHRPRRILEIGGGLTSLHILRALAKVDELEALERKGLADEATLLNPDHYAGTSPPAVLHLIDNMVHPNTTARSVAAEAARLGIDGPLAVHEADFVGYVDTLPKQDLPLDFLWFDCGKIEYFQHLRRHYWPLVSRNGGLILVHSLATNFHGQLFLSQLKLEQATKSFDEFELITLLEPHKRRQNSVTMIRLIGALHTQINSIMP